MIKNFLMFFLVLLVSCCTYAQAEKNKIFYTDGPSDKKMVALTFDDGPGGATEKVLKILKDKNVKATFFMLGSCVQINTETVKKVYDAGHEIANHTYSHTNFYSYKSDKTKKIEEELLATHNLIKDITGYEPFLARIPYGYCKQQAQNACQKLGYYLITWSAGFDWNTISAKEMKEKYIQAIKNGAIFLMHDGASGEKMTSFLGDFIDELKSRGYHIVPVGQLLNLERSKEEKK